MKSISSEIPEVVVKTGSMPGDWSPRAKVGALLLALGLYVYILLLLKMVYLKTRRLDHIVDMAFEVEQLMHQLHVVDQRVALQVARLNSALDEH